jgi:DNA-directed RNA polymerase alpha subunit
MELITTYQAHDGAVFQTMEECLAHEALLGAHEDALEAFLQCRDLSGQERELVRRAILDWEVHKRMRNQAPAPTDNGSSNLDVLELTVRTSYCLREASIRTLEALTGCTDGQLMRVSGLGRKTVNDIKAKLAAQGLRLKD